jgi:cytochrome c oxidase subunit 2
VALRDEKSLTFIKLALISVVVGVVGGLLVYLTPPWFPEAASVEADRHDLLYLTLMIVSSLIMGVVVTFLVYSIHGHTKLEVLWTLVPTAIVVGLAIYAGVVLERNEALADDRLRVEVTARQFIWTFHYADEDVDSTVLVLPLGREAEFDVTAPDDDVIHSFFVPEFRVKQDANPGIVRRTVATPTKLGTYPLICTELCGLGHAQMRAVVRVVPADEFERWLETQRNEGGPA